MKFCHLQVNGEHHAKWCKPDSEDKGHVFLICDRSNKYTSFGTHNTCIYMYIQNIFPKVGWLRETGEGGKEEKNGRKWIVKYITSVYEQDTMKCTENYWTIWGREVIEKSILIKVQYISR
jgi:hypothetical protein